MDDNREEKTLTIGTHTFVLKAYLSEREKRAVGGAYSTELDGVDASTSDAGRNLAIYNKLQDLTIKSIVISIDGHKEGDVVNDKPFSVLDTVLDLPSADYKEFYAEVKTISDGEQKKTN